MKLDFAIFGNAGTIKSDGTFGLLGGGLSWIVANKFPAKCKQLVLIVRVEFKAEECGKEYNSVVQVYSPEGNRLNPDQEVVMTPLLNSRTPGADTTTFAGMYFYDGFVFQTPGRYAFKVFVSDNQLGEITLHASEEQAIK